MDLERVRRLYPELYRPFPLSPKGRRFRGLKPIQEGRKPGDFLTEILYLGRKERVKDLRRNPGAFFDEICGLGVP